MLTYVVLQSFYLSPKRRLVADQPIQVASAEEGMRKAQRLAKTKAGVVVFSRTGDPQTGDFEDAVIVAAHGHLPPEIGEAMGQNAA